MRLMRLEQLESRDCPFFMGVRDNSVYLPDGNDFGNAFPDFSADHASAGDQDVVVIGAAEGGGPRVRIFEGVQHTVIGDFFAYEPEFRNGVLVAYENGIVVTGTNTGGGPVVAVWDKFGNQTARFFAYDPDFRGGVSVAIFEGKIFTVPGPGGGPVIKMFDFHGVELGATYGANQDLRDGWDIIVGDVTNDHVADITLANRKGSVSIMDGVSGYYESFQLPAGFTRAGYEGTTLTVGNEVDYVRGRALWTSYPIMSEFDGIDGAAGNPNPGPTSGTRPGVFSPTFPVGVFEPDFTNIRTLQEVPVSGNVETYIGSGSSYVPMLDEAGNYQIVTASHIARSAPYLGLIHAWDLDSKGTLVGEPFYISTITEGVPYVVDAISYLPTPGTVLSPLLKFGNQSVSLVGVATDLKRGDMLVSVGQQSLVGVGSFFGNQIGSIGTNWPSGDIPQMEGQYIGLRGPTPLSAPGFSGGVCFRVRFTADGLVRDLVGMNVAGNLTTAYITPHAAIQAALGLQ